MPTVARPLRCIRGALGALFALGVACMMENPSYDEGGDQDGGGTGPATDGPGEQGGSLPPPVDGPTDPYGGAEAAVPPDLLAGLIGYWRLDEASGTTARDSSGRNHHGTLEGISGSNGWVKGRLGGGLQIPASSDAGVRVAATALIDRLRRYTVAAWIQRATTGVGEYHSVISRQLGDTLSEVFNLSVTRATLRAYAPGTNENGEANVAWTSSVTLPVGVWVHAAASFDGDALRVYQDGRLLAELHPSITLPSTTTPLYLGTNKNPGFGEPLEGLLDEVLLYDRALPGEAVAALAAGQRPAVP